MACQDYVPTEWFDNTAPAINAANLNHIEQGIKNAFECTAELEARIVTLEAEMGSHTHTIAQVIDLQTELDRTPKGTWSRTDDVLTIDIEPLEVP